MPPPARSPRFLSGSRAARVPAPRRTSGEATRRRLLDAAGERFAALGFRGATLREIAERAGANLAAANYHFGSKEGLYLEVAREHFDALERRLVEQGADVASRDDLAGRSRGELEALLRVRVRTTLRSFLEEDPIHAALMQRELLDPSDALPVIVRRWVMPLRAGMEHIVAQLAPELTPDEIARASFSVVGQVSFYLTHRPALLLMMERRAWPRGYVDEVAEHVTEFTLGGIERLRGARAAPEARMNRRRLIALLLLLGVVAVVAVLWLRRGDGTLHYTGFVEGEQRVLRAEVSGRVLDVAFGEGDAVPADAIVARLDPSEIDARIASKRHELDVLEAQIRRQQEHVALIEVTWTQDVAAQEAALRQAEADAVLGAQTYSRTEKLRAGGVVAPQRLDESRAQRDATRSAVERARELLARSRAQAGEIELARRQHDILREQLELARSQLGELAVLRAKHDVRAPAAATVVQSQLLWPGELAQPGTPVLSVLDPRDKYVQIYVPVSDVERVRVGARVEIELDSAPGRRVPGEVSFVGDEANFTPEKIETRSDRLGQVYRAKVRILEDVERFQPGTEGNVYLVEETAQGAARHAANEEP